VNNLFYRNILKELGKWKKGLNRKPLVLRGARQIGKTTAVRLFSESYDQYIELNLEKKDDRSLFERELTVGQIMESLALKNRITYNSKTTLLFIDEIQNSETAVAYLRYFYEELPEIYVITAGSLLESLIGKRKISFPVGRVDYLYMYPCSFSEFLGATGNEQYLQYLEKLPFPMHLNENMLELFNRYILVGGMPEAVAQYALTGNIVDLQGIFRNLIIAYLDDVEKYAPRDSMVRIIRHIINTAPFQSGKRIKYQGFGNSDYGSRVISEAMGILEKALLIDTIRPTTSLSLPIQPDLRKSPKIQFLDIGISNFMAGLQSQLVTLQDFSTIERGRIVENAVYQEMRAHGFNYGNNLLNFWIREKKQSNSEIDFVFPKDDKIIPIEVKSGSSGRLRSLSVFMDQVDHDYSIRLYSGELKLDYVKTLTGKPFRLLNLPYFLAGEIENYIDWFINRENE